MRRADNLTTITCVLFRNSGSLNLLDPKKPVQACNVIAFFIYFIIIFYFIIFFMVIWMYPLLGTLKDM